MKRALKWVGLVVGLLVIAAASIWYSAFGSNSPIVDGQQVVPGVETVKDGFVSVFVIDVAPGKVALVDAGRDTPGKAILSELARREFGDSAGASRDGVMMKAVRLFSKDSAQNVASLKALEARLQPRETEIKALAFAHTGPLAGFEPFAAFASAR